MHAYCMDVVIYSNKLFVKLKKYYDNVLVFHEKSSLLKTQRVTSLRRAVVGNINIFFSFFFLFIHRRLNDTMSVWPP